MSEDPSLMSSFNSSVSALNFFQSIIAFFKGSISEYSLENLTNSSDDNSVLRDFSSSSDLFKILSNFSKGIDDIIIK